MTENRAYQVLFTVVLGQAHQPTGRTVHRSKGVILGPPSSLAIAQYPKDPGYYLFYLDERGSEVTDTYHDTIQGAMEQADFEFNVKPRDWIPAQ